MSKYYAPVKNIFKIHDTHGLPLIDIVDRLKEEGLNVDWKEWIRDTLKACWEYDKAKSMFLEAMALFRKDDFFRMAFVQLYLLVCKEEGL